MPRRQEARRDAPVDGSMAISTSNTRSVGAVTDNKNPDTVAREGQSNLRRRRRNSGSSGPLRNVTGMFCLQSFPKQRTRLSNAGKEHVVALKNFLKPAFDPSKEISRTRSRCLSAARMRQRALPVMSPYDKPLYSMNIGRGLDRVRLDMAWFLRPHGNA